MSSHHFHAVIWIDHHEARVFHFSPTDVERLVLHPDHPTKHIHHKANSIGSGHASEDHAFLQAVAQSIADAGAVLVTGPANAKTELVKHISQHDPKLMRIIVGIETVDHPSDGQLVAHARHYFKAAVAEGLTRGKFWSTFHDAQNHWPDVCSGSCGHERRLSMTVRNGYARGLHREHPETPSFRSGEARFRDT
jgi:stalled ribosome rescue protein Dom34